MSNLTDVTDLLKLWLSFFCLSLARARTSASVNDRSSAVERRAPALSDKWQHSHPENRKSDHSLYICLFLNCIVTDNHGNTVNSHACHVDQESSQNEMGDPYCVRFSHSQIQFLTKCDGHTTACCSHSRRVACLTYWKALWPLIVFILATGSRLVQYLLHARSWSNYLAKHCDFMRILIVNSQMAHNTDTDRFKAQASDLKR